jgi:CRISPR-associated Csx10 family RAMP protein
MTYTETHETSIFDVSFNLVSAVCLSTGRVAGNITSTTAYISGSTLRGALAAAYLSRHNRNADAIFERLFLSGVVSYGNLYPRQQAGESFPLPLSAHSCKHKAGFQLSDPEAHGVVDLLLDVAEYAIKSKQGVSMDTRRQDECRKPEGSTECGAPLEPFTEFCEQTGAGHYRQVELPKRVITRSATDDRTHTAERGQLYSLEVLDSPDDASTVFGGEIICSTQEAVALFDQHLRPILEIESLFVGTAKSRGLGEIRIQDTGGLSRYAWEERRIPLSEGEGCGETSDPQEGRFAAFQRALAERGITDGRLCFSVTLRSDAILEGQLPLLIRKIR